MPVQTFLTAEEEAQIVAAIVSAEKKTSGEIRVHLEGSCQKDPFNRAQEVFKKLKMHRTKERNAILFYVAVDSRNFVIFGDEGIHQKVQNDFWETTKNAVIQHFTKGEFSQGIVNGIFLVGEQLKKYFPVQSDDSNELPNEISHGKI